MKHTCFTVSGKPFFSIGGQIHNSSGYALGASDGAAYQKDREEIFKSLKALGANTVAVPICWDAFEPEEDKFDCEYVTRMIDRVRDQNLHLIFLWFATWKNGQMEYVPAWVKRDRKRFPRAVCSDGQETGALSPFYEENRKRDEIAFCQLMQIIKEYDEKVGTVLAVQVENEPGMCAASMRDFSSKGNEVFLSDVPEEIIHAAEEDKGPMHEAWIKKGCKTSGSWETVFGYLGSELCMSWATADYIDRIAGAGKQVYDLFLYVNVWLDRCGDRGWSIAGLNYPSGGAVSKDLPVWMAVCKNLDAIAPDIYESDPSCFQKTLEIYDQEDMPLYVPESGVTNLNATMMFEAVGKHQAIGYHIFGAESTIDEEGNLLENAKGVMHSFTMLRNVSDLIIQSWTGDIKMYTFTQNVGKEESRLSIGDWLCRVSYAGAEADCIGWSGMDYRHQKDSMNAYHVPMSLGEETSRGILFQISKNEFYLVGHKVRLYWQKIEKTDGSIPVNMINFKLQSANMEFLCIEEGHFEDGKFVSDRRRSGDEARNGVWAQFDCGVVHFVLGE